MDLLCEQFEYSNLKPKLSYNFITDFNIIIEQIKITNKTNMIDICLECNDKLSWNKNEYINIFDYNWLISHGYYYLNNSLNNNNNLILFNELINIFKLQLN